MPYAYRRLSGSDADLARARGLLSVFGAAFGDRAAYDPIVPTDARLRALLDKPDVIVVVASDGENVVGGLVAYVLDKLERKRPEVYLYDLAVDEAHRRRGLARGLIARLAEIVRERGAYVIFVQADPGDDAAIALYTSLGAREDVHHFDIEV